MNEQQLVDLSSAVLATQLAILAGMIKAGVVDAKAMRDWIQSLIDDLKPEERQKMYGVCLAQVIVALDRGAGTKPMPPKLH